MISNEEESVLHETSRNARMAIAAIDAVMNKLYNEDMAYDLNCQSNKYREFGREAERTMIKEGILPHEGSRVEKAMLWTSIQANTIWNTSTAHIAEMMIRENTRGITELMKATHNNKVKGSYANELANELMDFEERCIEKLKSYL